MKLTFTPDGAAVIITPTSEEAAALGGDFGLMLDWLTSALIGMAHLRNGTAAGLDSQSWHYLINDTERRLAPRLDGIRDALIRTHAAAGGTYGDLALALDVKRSTAQYRRDKVTDADPSIWEKWATGTLPGYAPADWSAQVFLRYPDTAPGRDPDDEIHETVTLSGLTDEQARELETLPFTDDPQHTVTIGARTFKAPDVQVVKVSRTAGRPATS